MVVILESKMAAGQKFFMKSWGQSQLNCGILIISQIYGHALYVLYTMQVYVGNRLVRICIRISSRIRKYIHTV